MTESGDNLLQQLDRYTVQERIGTGGMARVYRASDNTLDRDVAVKVLHEHLADDENFRARFEREAKFIAKLNHPNVIQIFDYATLERNDNYLCYMVMTYLPGQSLKDIMDENMESERVMPSDQILRITQDITAALDYAHRQGMVHRDIKPANILFDERGQAILTDFGIARLAESSKLTQENVAVGTPAYMAPEQAAGEKVDARTDIYAFGVILYELLAGQPPFGDDGSISVLIKHLNEPVPPLTELEHIDNEYLDAIVMKALAKNPTDRYQSAGEIATDLEQAIAGQPPQALTNAPQAPTPIEGPNTTRITAPFATVDQPTTPQRNNTPLTILIAGLLAVILLLGTAFFLNQQNVRVVVAPTLEQPAIPTATPTLDPSAFRNLGGIDSMTQDEENASDVNSMTSADDMGFMTDFSPNDDIARAYWPLQTTVIGSREGEVTRELSDQGVYIITNTIRNLAANSIISDFYYTKPISIRAEMSLTTESENNSGYGLVFHYQDEQNYGVFAVDGEGRYSIWFLEAGQWRELRNLPDEDWTRNAVVNQRGKPNSIRLDIRDATLAGFVNGEKLVELTDDSITEGGVGVYMANPNRENAIAEVLVDSYEVILVDEEDDNTSSMTGS
jgi:serine/threonine protein kinase